MLTLLRHLVDIQFNQNKLDRSCSIPSCLSLDLQLQKTPQFKAAQKSSHLWIDREVQSALLLFTEKTVNSLYFFQKRKQTNKQTQVGAHSIALHLLFFTAQY